MLLQGSFLVQRGTKMTSLVDVNRFEVLKPNFAFIYTLGNTQKSKEDFKRLQSISRDHFLLWKPNWWKCRIENYTLSLLTLTVEVFWAKFSLGWKTSHVFKMHFWSLQLQKRLLALSLPFQRHYVHMQPWSPFQANQSSARIHLFMSSCHLQQLSQMPQEKAKYQIQNEPFDLGLIQVHAANLHKKQKSSRLLLGTWSYFFFCASSRVGQKITVPSSIQKITVPPQQ